MISIKAKYLFRIYIYFAFEWHIVHIDTHITWSLKHQSSSRFIIAFDNQKRYRQLIVHWTVIYWCIEMIIYFTMSCVVTIERRYQNIEKRVYITIKILSSMRFILFHIRNMFSKSKWYNNFIFESFQPNFLWHLLLIFTATYFQRTLRMLLFYIYHSFYFHDLKHDRQIAFMKIMSFISF